MLIPPTRVEVSEYWPKIVVVCKVSTSCTATVTLGKWIATEVWLESLVVSKLREGVKPEWLFLQATPSQQQNNSRVMVLTWLFFILGYLNLTGLSSPQVITNIEPYYYIRITLFFAAARVS